MAWFFRAVETPKGLWECRHGRKVVFDVHAELEEALSHLQRLADEREHSVEIFVHWLDGQAGRVDAGWILAASAVLGLS